MCEFFSFVTDAKGKKYYFDWKQRTGNVKTPSGQTIDNHDSHSEICAFYDLDCDKANKYEYNPLLKKFEVDQINGKDNSEQSVRWVKQLDFKTIVEPLVIKQIINPLSGEPKAVTEREIQLLHKWDSVWDSVRASVWAYTSSFFNIPLWKIRNNEYKENPFQPCIDLWESGFVPSFDGKTWRIHSGKKAEIVYEAAKNE